MGHGTRPDGPRHFDDRDRLLRALGGDREWVDLAAQHVGPDQDPHEAIEHCRPRIDFVMLDRADRHRLGLDGLAFRGRSSAGVDVDGMNLVSTLRQAGHAVRGIEATGEGEGDNSAMHNA